VRLEALYEIVDKEQTKRAMH